MPRASLDTLPPSSPGKLAHIVLRSRDPKTVGEWYKTVLNARPVIEGGSATALTYDAEHHRVLVIGMAPDDAAALNGDDVFDVYDKRRKLPGLEHFAFTHDNIANLLSTYRRLKRENIEPAFCVNHGGTLSLYYLDPDGNNVEMQIDTMTMDQAIEMMHTPAFRLNGVGYPFDPEELCQRYEAGEPLSALLASPYNTPVAA
jgi:catechol-2,3-dioxygenase